MAAREKEGGLDRFVYRPLDRFAVGGRCLGIHSQLDIRHLRLDSFTVLLLLFLFVSKVQKVVTFSMRKRKKRNRKLAAHVNKNVFFQKCLIEFDLRIPRWR